MIGPGSDKNVISCNLFTFPPQYCILFPDQEEQRRPTGHKTEALGKGKKPLHQLQVSDRLNLTEKSTHFFSGYFSSLYTSNNVFGKF